MQNMSEIEMTALWSELCRARLLDVELQGCHWTHPLTHMCTNALLFGEHWNGAELLRTEEPEANTVRTEDEGIAC